MLDVGACSESLVVVDAYVFVDELLSEVLAVDPDIIPLAEEMEAEFEVVPCGVDVETVEMEEVSLLEVAVVAESEVVSCGADVETVEAVAVSLLEVAVVAPGLPDEDISLLLVVDIVVEDVLA